MSVINCFTLSYNLASETEKVIKKLHALNDCKCFKHLIVDLGFPLVEDEIPDDLDASREKNTELLKKMALDYGSEYVRFENIGVSQNWTQVYNHIKPDDRDILIGCDPDEHPLDRDWLIAMQAVILEGDFGLASLMMTTHIPLIKNVAHNERWFANRRVYILPEGSLNWALIGISGKFFNLIKEIPYPVKAPRYGYIEGSLYPYFRDYGMGWCVLADFRVRHTDFELGDPGTSKLLREWKNQIIFNIHQYGQLSFDDFLILKKEGRI